LNKLFVNYLVFAYLCGMTPEQPPFEVDVLEVTGARVHNLKNLNVRLPRNQLSVITGLSGSGKSSLAFDTIYAEGQRRFMETLSSYARQFIGQMERPDVDQIDGLSPVISIEQKTTGRNPRSTVGTITELYDFLRLLFARTGTAYSYLSGNAMVKMSDTQILETILTDFQQEKVALLAPVIRGRKGHYRELLESIRKQGYTKARIDGTIVDIQPEMMLDRYKVHDIEVVITRMEVREEQKVKLFDALQLAFKMGEGLVFVLKLDDDNAAPRAFSISLMDPETGLSYEEPSPNTFSFNSPYGWCADCQGIGEISEADPALIIPDRTKSIAEGGLSPLGEYRDSYVYRQVDEMAKKLKFSIKTPIDQLPEDVVKMLLFGGSPVGKKLNKAILSSNENLYDLAKEGLANMLTRVFVNSDSERMSEWAGDYIRAHVCPTCEGTRVRKEARYFRIGDYDIGQLANKSIGEFAVVLSDIEKHYDERQLLIAHEILKELRSRSTFLLNVGLEYLSLNRTAGTLSGGESQRIRLATQIGSQLTGVTYILDEPSIGLHQRDNQRLIHSLRQLTDIGNTVIVVEHDKDIMLAADYVVDIGPGAGKHGGQIVSEGKPADFMKNSSVTSDYLANRRRIEIPTERRKGRGEQLVLKGAKGHNLKNVDLELPLGTLICVTGVSGSGKSTLITETLYPALRQLYYNSIKRPLAYDTMVGADLLDKVIEIDQAAIGRSPRSNPVTYTNVFTDIRKMFSLVPESKIRGYSIGRFSFNVKGGRCETCEGAGRKVIEMTFLPDVEVECDTCFGKRYNRETLEILYKGKSISDVLDMSVEEAVVFFEAVPAIYRKIKTLLDVGLGYITLGQQATTLSGGEAQRIKLAEELSKKDTGRTLYILDEPTTGLHFDDIRQLLVVLQRLVDRGNTVLVIEHNLDVVKVADYVIDIGPEGGGGGGSVVCSGTPEVVAKCKESYTGMYLKGEL
jgi:excinuclease ABC subunit A